jgi:hypothetical protein
MLPSQRSLPLPYCLFDLAGRQAERLGLQVGDLRLETLFKDAQQQTRLADFGSPYFLAGLNKLLESLGENVQLRFYGRLVMRLMLTNYLSQRLMFVDAQKNKPELFASLKQPPIIITGLHRSGTTFLHRLLAVDPANSGTPFWWLYRPFQHTGALDFRKIQAWMELSILKPIFPGIQFKHCIRPFDSEESCWMLGMTFHSMVFWILSPVTSYLRWLWEQDMREVYREYALLLQALQRSAPDQRLVMKAPDHMPHLDLLLDAVPEAHIVQLHRDPTTCVLSLSSLFYATHIALSERVNLRLMAEANQAMTAKFLQANRAVRRNPDVDRRVLDINYEDLVNDPEKTVRGIYDHFGFAFSEGAATRTSQFLNCLRGRDPQAHHYSGVQFGLSEPELRAFFLELLNNQEPTSMLGVSENDMS